ncbi:MAG: DUF1801 domain-containing protein [Rhizobiales bacterium]|nr:DUF1801 domain-containing protein [Hyphomicrobiales bacterium]MBO6698905.1 DUF1801 domain-containing protein [Hyphomicrobiales bacterium]MBO6734842.1 DUF1801 domain-containing protein [Hyphomicrobiales bacterium]MBO6911352.1 DUF1801 domain-containing protein [Hyphomicrobiales bacterium]MBO6955515.1 DUF1801 domain-containing protein [Hyphomicrobiales bacterium]
MAKIPRTMPTEVADAINAMPEPSRTRVLQLRDLVLAEAAARGIAPLEETLKWGQPSYLPGRAGTTIRLGADETTGGAKLFVHCQTTLVDDWRSRFGNRLAYEGNRAVLIDPEGPLPTEELSLCIGAALTYHSSKRAQHG